MATPTDQKIASIITDGKPRARFPQGGANVSPTIVVDLGGTEHHFQLGRDGTWRYASTSGWAGYSGTVCDNPRVGLNRPCCDASGHRVLPAWAEVLDTILDECGAIPGNRS